MKAYCRICALIQPSSFRPCNDAATGALYEDLCCDTCDFIVATVEERETLAQPAREPVGKFAKFTDGVWREVTNGSAGIPLYTTPPQRPRVVFPTMLRKMWSGGEVQAWLDENVNKENKHD